MTTEEGHSELRCGVLHLDGHCPLDIKKGNSNEYQLKDILCHGHASMIQGLSIKELPQCPICDLKAVIDTLNTLESRLRRIVGEL